MSLRKKTVILHLRSSAGGGGGPEKTIYETGRRIDKNRFNYQIAYLRKSVGDLTPIAERAREADLDYHEFPGKDYFDIRQLFLLAGLIRRSGVQILHTHDTKTDFYGFLLKCFFPGLKIVSTVHGWIRRSKKSTFYYQLDRFVLRFFHRVVAVSGEIAGRLREAGIKKVRVIHNAIDIDEWRPGSVRPARPDLPADSFTVGYAGRVSMEKGPLDFVRVAGKLLQQKEDFFFLVAGEGPQLEVMKEMINELGVAHRFQFLGRLERSEMVSFYQWIDLLLSPSRTEGLPNNILEALAMSVPIVATAVGGVGEIIEDRQNGLLAASGDTERMAELVLEIRGDGALRDKIREAGRFIVEKKFSFEARLKEIENLYLELSGQNG